MKCPKQIKVPSIAPRDKNNTPLPTKARLSSKTSVQVRDSVVSLITSGRAAVLQAKTNNSTGHNASKTSFEEATELKKIADQLVRDIKGLARTTPLRSTSASARKPPTRLNVYRPS